MPLLKPDIQKVLREVGLDRSEKSESLEEKIDNSGLGLNGVLEDLAFFVKNSSSEGLKLRAIETALKLHGVLKEREAAPPSITIVINDPLRAEGTNPILIPREVKKVETIQ